MVTLAGGTTFLHTWAYELGGVGGGGEGVCCPQLRRLCDFSGKMLMIRAMTLERKHYKIMLLV